MMPSVLTTFSSRKTLEAIKAEADADSKHDGVKLHLFDLLCIGIGTTIGSSVFILTGDILPKTGPSAIISWAVAGSVCLLSAFSYLELSIRIPTSGSCYVFSYHAIGELAGIVGAVCLTMEYGISGAGVARGWSRLVANLTGKGDVMFLWYPGTEPSTSGSDLYFDFTAGLIMLASVGLCSSGLSIGKLVINFFTVLKVLLVAFLIVAGLCAWQVDVFESSEVFFPNGVKGTIRGVSALFFGFIGFDEVCCLAGKADNPAKTMPRALAGTLAVAASVSTLAQFSLSVMAPAAQAAPWPEAFGHIGWEWAKFIANAGELVLLPLVVLLSFLPQPELLGSMAKDGLIPSVFGRTDAAGTFVWGSNAIGAVMVAVAACVPFNVLWNMISLGVLLSFNLTNTSLIMVRCGNGGKVASPKVSKLVFGLWVCAAAGGYSFWRGVAEPVLDDEPFSILALVVFILAFLGDIVLMVAIGRYVVSETESEKPSFLAPAVPYVPGTALILNFMLMATMSWSDHLYLALFITAFLVIYLTYSARRVRKASVAKSVKDFIPEENATEVHCTTSDIDAATTANNPDHADLNCL